MTVTSSTGDESRNRDEVCPICLRGDETDDDDDDDEHGVDGEENRAGRNGLSLVSGGCRHKFCLPCLQRVFASSGNMISTGASIDPNSPDAILSIPTQDEILHVPTVGRCPICRSTLFLLDLKWEPRDSIDGCNAEHPVRVNASSMAENQFAVPRVGDVRNSELAGLIFVKRRRGVGDGSIHFPAASPTGDGNIHNGESTVLETSRHQDLPFLNMETAKHKVILDDGTNITSKNIYFQKSSIQYHRESRTFHGTIQWDSPDDDEGNNSEDNGTMMRNQDCGKRFRQSSKWQYIMSFSSDFRYVAKGAIIQQRNPCRRRTCPRPECKFLCDGEWTVTWPNHPSLKSSTTRVRVHGNRFVICMNTTSSHDVLRGDSHRTGWIDFEAHDTTGTFSAYLLWPDDRGAQEGGLLRQKLSPSFTFNVQHHPSGPTIGEQIEWLESSEEYPSMVWRRETVAPYDLPLRVVKLGSEHSNADGISSFYHQLGAIDDRTRMNVPAYIPETLWGNVFVQAFTVGMASYHFLNEEDGAYISYEHERTSVWPNLDNGQPIPSRIYFTNTSFDPATNIFRGKIDWEGVHGTSWNGSRWWNYEILFARDYSCIVGGKVYARQRGSIRDAVMSTFGNELLYLNAGFVEEAKDELDADRDPLNSVLGEANRFRAIRNQMEDIGAPAENIQRLQAMFFLAQAREIAYPSTSLT